MGKMIELTASDGHKLSAYRADPASKPRGAIVVIQEIFGVNSHIRSVADGYAADGYVAIAPALFDRVKTGVDLGYAPDDIAKGRELRVERGRGRRGREFFRMTKNRGAPPPFLRRLQIR